MALDLKSKLDEIVGKTYNYKGKNITIDKYKQINGTNTVIFIPQPLNFLNHEVQDFLDNLYEPIIKEKSETEVLIPQQKLVSFEPTRENKEIKSTLLATLEKLKTDPGYIPQATAICDVVNQMVSLQRNEIQMLNVLSKIK